GVWFARRSDLLRIGIATDVGFPLESSRLIVCGSSWPKPLLTCTTSIPPPSVWVFSSLVPAPAPQPAITRAEAQSRNGRCRWEFIVVTASGVGESPARGASVRAEEWGCIGCQDPASRASDRRAPTAAFGLE